MDKLWKVSQKWWMTEINDGVSPWWSDRTLRVHLPCHVQHRRVPSDSQTKLEVQNLDECAAWLCFSVCPRWAVFGQSRWLIHSGLTHEYTTTPVYLQPNPPPQGPAVLLNSLFIAHSSGLMSSWDLTKLVHRSTEASGQLFSRRRGEWLLPSLSWKLNKAFQKERIM